VTIDGLPYVAKHLRPGGDWLMRASGDFGVREVALWERGVFAALPDEIDPAVVAVARDDHAAVVLMRDVSEHLLPQGDDPLTIEEHDAFLGGLAALHAGMWGWRDDVGLLTTGHRHLLFHPSMCDVEVAFGGDNPIPELVREGWGRFDARQPRSASAVHALYGDPSPFVRALDRTPSTLVHGDVKIANAGQDPAGRTILIDWALAGPGPACVDLAWHLSVNAARLPESKEATIARYRGALEGRGRNTEPWWERQLALCLLGSFAQMGWEKAFGNDDELAWWDEQATAALRFLS
jgi:hypothetical protein